MSKIKRVSFLLVISLLLSLFSSVAYAYSPDNFNKIIVCGDADRDGAITSSDYLLTKLVMCGQKSVDDLTLYSCDADGDGIIGSSDYLKIKAHCVGKYKLEAISKARVPVNNAEYLSEALAWLSDAGDATLLNEDEIKALNAKTLSACNPIAREKCKMLDMTDKSVYSGKTLGIVTERSNLKSAFDSYDLEEASQETELHVGFPVFILEEMGERYRVQCHFYTGWVDKTAVAKAKSESEWLEYANPSDFVVVLAKSVTLNGKFVDMSVKLPYDGISDGSYNVLLPSRNWDGTLYSEKASISVSNASHGYARYTKNNFILQAFKYLNTPYGWGGLNNLCDCSSYCANIYRCFGIIIARDTTEQGGSFGESIDLTGKSPDEIKSLILSYDAPYPIYTSGHVMIYLGTDDLGVPHVIHQSEPYVSVMPLTYSIYSLIRLCPIKN